MSKVKDSPRGEVQAGKQSAAASLPWSIVELLADARRLEARLAVVLERFNNDESGNREAMDGVMSVVDRLTAISDQIAREEAAARCAGGSRPVE